MLVYFVRHGETNYNADKLHQPPTAPLSEKGIRQAEALARRLSRIPIERIVASPFTRARQTADIINSALRVPLEESALFQEMKRPGELVENGHNAIETVEIMKQILEHHDDPKWHFSDEENFFDLKTRAEKALDLLIRTHNDMNHILVVTHGNFLRAVLGVASFEEAFTPDVFQKLYHFSTHNAGVTVLEYDEHGHSIGIQGPHWHVVAWNDHAHLPV